MTNGQRRIHKYIWLIMALILPVLVFMSVRHLNLESRTAQQSSDAELTPNALIVEQDWIKTAIVDTEDGNTLHLRLKKPLKHPSALVYTLNDNGQKGELLGQLQGIGDYEFTMKSSFEGILIYDAIKGVEIEKLEFSWD